MPCFQAMTPLNSGDRVPTMLRRSFTAGLAGFWLPSIAKAAPRMASDPFGLGIASGCPTPESVVLWTRLVAENGFGERLAEPVVVDWAIAEDDAMRKVVRTGQATAEARWAHSIHVVANGLRPARPYWYRFAVRGAESPIGRTKTAPAAADPLAKLRFAFASCQQYEQGYFTPFRHMAAEDADFVVHLGDYIYEKSWGRDLVRRHDGGLATTLEEYRDRYAQYKSDRDLQASHAAFPWIVTWDDHEVADDYAGDVSPVQRDPARFLAQRAEAYQAYWEHMPLPPSMQPQGPSMRLHDRYRFGQLAEIHVLDNRQYRDHHACWSVLPRNKVMRGCEERLDPRRSMLGTAQEAWLSQGLSHASTRWTLIAQQTLVAQVDRSPKRAGDFWHDGWDGYAPARQRMIDAIAASPVRDTIVLSGDVHSFWAADLKRDFDDSRGPIVATEFVGGSITSQGPSEAAVHSRLAANPHLRYGQSEKYGYAHVTLDATGAHVAFRSVDSVKSPQSTITTLQSFVVESGKPGVVMD